MNVRKSSWAFLMIACVTLIAGPALAEGVLDAPDGGLLVEGSALDDEILIRPWRVDGEFAGDL